MSALKFVGKHMKRHKGKIIISLVLSIVISLVSSLGPYIMKLIVDVGIPEGRIEYILILSSMAVAVYFLYSMGNFLLSYIFTLLSETVNLDIKKEIYNKLMYYPLSFFGNKEKGYILARTNEINSIKPLFSSTTCKLGLSIIEFVIACHICDFECRNSMVWNSDIKCFVFNTFVIRIKQKFVYST